MPLMTYTGAEPVTLAVCEPHLTATPGQTLEVAPGLMETLLPLGFEPVAEAPKPKKADK